MLSQERRAQLAKKIKALLAKTTEAGCTEDEALAAALAAAKLQAEYNINLTDVELLEEGFEQITLAWKSSKAQFIEDRIAAAVAYFTSTRVWVVRPQKEPGRVSLPKREAYKMVFCGLKSDAVFGAWLLESLRDYTLRHATFYGAINGAAAARSFTLGICARIAGRLMASKFETIVKHRAPDATRALVVLDKQLMISEYLKEKDITLKRDQSYFDDTVTDVNAFYEGSAHGENVGLNKPINSSGTVRYIK